MIILNTPTDLYNLILKENLNVKQVNTILESFLIQKSFIFFDDYTPIQIVELLKDFFTKYNEAKERPFFIGNDPFQISDIYKRKNNLFEYD